MAKKRVNRRQQEPKLTSFVPLATPTQANDVCLELEDHSVVTRSAIAFFHLRHFRDPGSQAARLTSQFIIQNQAALALLNVQISQDYDGQDVHLRIASGNAVGAVPLLSPTSAQADYGLLVQPRFPWRGIGPMLAQMGWRITPTLLRMPLLRRSERRVPLWLLSSTILMRLKGLLDSLDRRFEISSQLLNAPRGTVNWTEYATRSIPNAKWLAIPCAFPDLREDKVLKGAVRYCLERQLSSLETQKEHGAFVHLLIEVAQHLLVQVRLFPPCIPSARALGGWLRRPMRTPYFLDGIQAMNWTLDERGLAGSSDLEGIPWTMPMDQFFEAWVETVFLVVARRTGANVRTGRKRETVHAISWEPAFVGSQRSLIPDLIVEWPTLTMIVDAKYKRHWEDIHDLHWNTVDSDLREQHRNDLLQVLAYANLARNTTIIACLIYPCSKERWLSMRERHRHVHKAEITVASRALQIWVTAIPMATDLEEVAAELIGEIRLAIESI